MMDMVNKNEGTAVYKFYTDCKTKITDIEVVKSSGSASLDNEGKRLLWQVPGVGQEFPDHEISINFNLNDNKIYDILEEMPEFPGGNVALLKYIDETFRWPPEVSEMGIQGRTICKFVVEKDGLISIVEVVRSLDKWIDAEVIRVIKSMPAWKPGKKDGKPVRVYYFLPVKIR